MTTSKTTLLNQLTHHVRIEISLKGDPSNKRHYAECIGCLPDHSLLITEPSLDGTTLDLQPRQQVNARMLLHGELFSFVTNVLRVCTLPTGYVHLQIPEQIRRSDVRAWPRVSVVKTVSVETEGLFSDGSQRTDAQMVNISAGGALLEAPIQFGLVGDQLRLVGSFSSVTGEHELSLPIIIRQIRIREESTSCEAYSMCGVEFLLQQCAEDERMRLYSYVYERLLAAKTSQLV